MEIGLVTRIKKKLQNIDKRRTIYEKNRIKARIKLPNISPARSLRTLDVPKLLIFPANLKNSQSKPTFPNPLHQNSQISLKPSLKNRSHSPNPLNKSEEISFNTFLTSNKIHLNPINSFRP